MAAAVKETTEQSNREDLLRWVLGAMQTHEGCESAGPSGSAESEWQPPAVPQLADNCPSDDGSTLEDAMPVVTMGRIMESAISDAVRFGKYMEHKVDHLQAINCTTKEEVDDYFSSERKTLASIYLAVSKAQPSPAELTKLALRLALDPRKPIEGDPRRFELRRKENGWEIVSYPSLAYKVPAIPLPGRLSRDVFVIQILDCLQQDPLQTFHLMDHIEKRLGCVPSESDGLDEETIDEDTAATSQIRVEVEKEMVWLGDEPISVSTAAAYFIDALISAKGNWVSFPKDAPTEEHRQMISKRPDRIRKKLPSKLREMVESKGGKGCRLRMT